MLRVGPGSIQQAIQMTHGLLLPLFKKTNKMGWGGGNQLRFSQKKTNKLLLTRQQIKINVYKICPFHCFFFF